MSRAALPELPSTHPLGGLLPGLYAADDLAQRFTGGLDEVLSAILSTLDNIAAYFDPALAPEDFVTWLASWVGADVDPAWPLARRRAVVRRAVELHHRRGTARGLVDRLELSLGVRAEVVDGPAVRWSATPGADLPGEPARTVVVRVRPGRSGPVDRARVEALVAAVCPVHVRCAVEVLPGEEP
ncbi:phage tail protein [Saccharothrix algeriensis]|uniref:Phage tail protein n=1 Tax=Saccharothrix algeriensis TaxID=173560 RepID=A0A8T8HXZ8_9PSEU|nr:phage tail protein [Saccharothrix algeriensis]MBM7815038.1 phage tail-like protein [Saccharothrix algeriensis]QTR03287.1 phage tail protein [Saccharothrix algeriensis]